MNRDLEKIVTTAGDRFALEAMRLAQRRFPTVGWLAPLRVKIERDAARPTAADERFQRRELPMPRNPFAPPPAAAEASQPWTAPKSLRHTVAAQALPQPAPGRPQNGWQVRDVEVVRKPQAPAIISEPSKPAATPPVETVMTPTAALKPSDSSMPAYRGPSLAEIIVGPAVPAPAKTGNPVNGHAPAPTKEPPGRVAEAQVVAPSAGRPDRGMPLPADTREKLRDVVGPEVAAMRVHNDRRADAIAREHHAAAVTIGHEVFFRERAYKPREPEGLSLLAHEATHVVEAMNPGAAWRRATDGGVRSEEALAYGRERAVRASPGPSGPSAMRAPSRPAAPSREAAAAPQKRPMPADMDRSVAGPGPGGQHGALDIEALRRDLFRDLMAKIKVEFERGA